MFQCVRRWKLCQHLLLGYLELPYFYFVRRRATTCAVSTFLGDRLNNYDLPVGFELGGLDNLVAST
jgi:hypothetical protein